VLVMHRSAGIRGLMQRDGHENCVMLERVFQYNGDPTCDLPGARVEVLGGSTNRAEAIPA
jgi:hypothetical protein